MAKKYPGTLFDPTTRTWMVRWWETDAQGKRVRRNKRGFNSAADAYQYKLDQTGKTPLTVETLRDRFLRVHSGAESTKSDLRWALNKFVAVFGDQQPDEITPEELERFAASIPEGHRFEVTRAVKQMFKWGYEKAEVLRRDPARKITNKLPTREEITPFQTQDEIDAVAEEIGEWGGFIRFLAATGLRPGEAIALERRDLDRNADPPVVLVRRRLSKDKKIEQATKNGKTRRVPLNQIALDALDALPPRIDTLLVFPAPRGGFLDLHNLRNRDWYPALDAAGLEKRGLYSLRHTFATFALARGMNIFALARVMGTSVAMIDKHYAHLPIDADEAALRFLSPKSGLKTDSARGAK
jgi:integrase